MLLDSPGRILETVTAISPDLHEVPNGMPLQIIGDRDSNTVEIDDDLSRRLNGAIRMEGSGNVVKIGKTTEAVAVDIHLLGNGNTCLIEEGLCVSLFKILAAGRATLHCGAKLRVIGNCRVQLPEPSSVTIGRDCMFADQVEVMTSDFHPILDADTGERINPARDVEISSHVWIGLRATILKGARIGTNSVIGAHAVVAGMIPEGCIAVGNPARIVRRGVKWRIPF